MREGVRRAGIGGSVIRAIVAAVPKTIVHNTDARFVAATGVEQRRVAAPLQNTHNLAVVAAARLLEHAGQTPRAIIFVTQTPIARMPATACALAHALGLDCPAFDVNLACSGYVYGLWLATTLARDGYSPVLLIAGDTISRMVSQDDPATSGLFGDAATASLIDGDGVAEFTLGTDGSGFDRLIANPMIKMDGPDVFGFAISRVPKLVADVTMNQHVDLFLFHQANAPMLMHIGKKAKIPFHCMPMNINKYGNTSAASIPLLMADSGATESLRTRSQKVGLFGFGAGYSWAGALLELEPMAILETVEI